MLNNSGSHYDSTHEESSSKSFFSASLHKNKEEDDYNDSDDDNKYAVKTLRNDLQGETKLSGAVDLAHEAQFLSRLSHPHIVKLHGSGGVPGSHGFFIIVDRVRSTLSDAINTFRWQRNRMKLVGGNGVRLDKKGKAAELQRDFDRRVDITRQLASALQYLHENS